MCFVAIIAWLSIVIGIGVLHVISRPWCAPGSDCANVFWPRLTLAAAGGIGAFLTTGYGLLQHWSSPRLTLFGIGGIALTVTTGLWFVPIIFP